MAAQGCQGPGGKGGIRPSLLLGTALGTEPQVPLLLDPPHRPTEARPSDLGSATPPRPRLHPFWELEGRPGLPLGSGLHWPMRLAVAVSGVQTRV